MSPGEQENLLIAMVAEITRLGALIGLQPEALPGLSRRTNADWIEVYWREAADGDDEDGWYLALMRNEADHDWELAEVAADTPDPPLYDIFEERTGAIARTRAGGAGSTWFPLQVELLHRLNPRWAAKRAERQAVLSRQGAWHR